MNFLGTLLTYAAPLAVFGLVVFVHELGHFLAAKATGVYAPVFSLGWGRRLFGVRRGETDYRVSIFPLGGYVRMASREDEAMAGIEGGNERGALDAPAPANSPLWDPESMAPFGPRPVPADRWVENKPVAARVLILSAGVLMNILLTLGVSTSIFWHYGRPYVPAVVDSVVTGAPAAVAGIQAGDSIVAINGRPVTRWNDVLDIVAPATSGELTVDVERRGVRSSHKVVPQTAEVTDSATGTKTRVGRIGVQVRKGVVREPMSLGESVQSGARATWGMAASVFDVLEGLVTRRVSVTNLGGPLQIAQVSVQAARSGAETFWSLIAFLSINIAILNLVPIPVLDGGQILLVLAEAVKGSEFSTRTREAFARVGIFAVLALIVLVMFNDARAMLK